MDEVRQDVGGYEPEYDDDFDLGDCWNCGGEGFVYGCSWDWQCDTYDPGEGSCLCTRRCHVCNPAPHPTLPEQLPEDGIGMGGEG